MKSSNKTWPAFWASRKKILLIFAAKISLALPVALLFATKFAASIDCFLGKSGLCIPLSEILERVPSRFAFFILFGIFVLCCQFTYFHWGKYLEEKEEELETHDELNS